MNVLYTVAGLPLLYMIPWENMDYIMEMASGNRPEILYDFRQVGIDMIIKIVIKTNGGSLSHRGVFSYAEHDKI